MKDSQSLLKKQKRFTKKTVKAASPSTQKKSFSFPTITLPKVKIPIVKNVEKNLALLLIPLALFLVFLLLNAINEYYAREISQNQLAPFPVETELNPYPFVNTVPLIPLSAKAAVVMDGKTKVILFSKNSELRFSMASTTKIMTALVAMEYYKDDSILTVQNTRVEGTTLGLLPGSQFYFKDLLYAMMLPSANDAAVAIADNYPGGSSAFVDKMNEKAQQLHLTGTHFVDPSGLEDDGDYTTVTDLARLAAVAMQNERFATVVGTKQKVITTVEGTNQYVLSNLNKLLGVNGVNGVKTGTTEAAGEVLVTSAVVKGQTVIIVVMNSEQRFVDTQALLNFISQNVQFITPSFLTP